MTTQERKRWLIKQIESINDDKIIDEVYALLEAESNSVYHFDEEQEQRLEQARLSIQNGNYKSNEQLKGEVSAWLHSL